MLRKNTEYLLQKATSQINKDKIQPSNRTKTTLNKINIEDDDDDDDLKDYLQSLEKNTKTKNVPRWDQDVSNLSDDEPVLKSPVLNNRFLKKKITQSSDNLQSSKTNTSQINTLKNAVSNVSNSISNDSTLDDNTVQFNSAVPKSNFLKKTQNNLSKVNDFSSVKKSPTKLINTHNNISINKDLDDSDDSIFNYLDIKELDVDNVQDIKIKEIQLTSNAVESKEIILKEVTPRKVSISTKNEIFKSKSSLKEIISRPITPATSRSYISTEIEEASELHSLSDNDVITYTKNSTIISTNVEILSSNKNNKSSGSKKKTKHMVKDETSASTNYSDDFDASVASSLASSHSAVSSSSVKSKKSKSKKQNNSTQTINNLHQHWIFSSTNLPTYSEPNFMYISAKSLKDLSAQSPAMDAFNDLLKQQLDIMRQYIHLQTNLHSHLVQAFNSLSPYKYTTLEDTRQFIENNKPKVIKYEEALAQVKRESNLINDITSQ